VPDDTGFEENVFQWLVPVHMAYTEADERLACQVAALEMLRSGTTCFLEAGTIRFLDPVVMGSRKSASGRGRPMGMGLRARGSNLSHGRHRRGHCAAGRRDRPLSRR